jgi:ribosomal protein L29
MAQLPPPQSLETVKRRAAKIQDICVRADAGIAMLDQVIAQLEQDLQASKLNQFHLRRKKQILQAQVTETESVS